MDQILNRAVTCTVYVVYIITYSPNITQSGWMLKINMEFYSYSTIIAHNNYRTTLPTEKYQKPH